jgi:hypothetical protein
MKQISFIDEGNDDDFGPDEFIPREPRTEQERQHQTRAKELQAKFRTTASSHFVRLDDDLAAAFPTPAAVNEALMNKGLINKVRLTNGRLLICSVRFSLHRSRQARNISNNATPQPLLARPCSVNLVRRAN